MSERIGLMLDEIRRLIQEAIDINKVEVDLIAKLSKTDNQRERKSLIYCIDMINADTFDFLDRIDGYVVKLEETLEGDSDED